VGVLPLHVTLQLVPSHAGAPEPAVGPGQAEHDVVPHELTSWLLTQVPPHSCVPIGHLQVPPLHLCPLVHAYMLPQPPQLLSSLLSSTQAPAHAM
jgi:hypothetical protein